MILNWLYFASGGQSLGLAIFAAAAIVIWSASVILLYRHSRGGVVTVDADGLVVSRSFGSRVRMRWGDVEAVRTATLRDAGAYARLKAKIGGVDVDRRVVDIKLRRALRPTLIPTAWATDAKGVSFGIRSLTLDVSSPDELVRAASGRIG
ncbi:MAG TPA: hypothetical protein VEZ14_14530 [Dehalococcoidia bacterium]|nr:hypothetical protein [Dehalococcoidia bacterium]